MIISKNLATGFAKINAKTGAKILSALREKYSDGKFYNETDIPIINAILDSYVDSAALVITEGGFSTNFINLFKNAVDKKFSTELQTKLDELMKKNNGLEQQGKELEQQGKESEQQGQELEPQNKLGGKKRKTKKNRRKTRK